MRPRYRSSRVVRNVCRKRGRAPRAQIRMLPKKIALNEYAAELKKILLEPARKLGRKENPISNAKASAELLRAARQCRPIHCGSPVVATAMNAPIASVSARNMVKL